MPFKKTPVQKFQMCDPDTFPSWSQRFLRVLLPFTIRKILLKSKKTLENSRRIFCLFCDHRVWAAASTGNQSDPLLLGLHKKRLSTLRDLLHIEAILSFSFLVLLCLYLLRRGFFFCCAVLSLPSPQRLLLLLRCFVFTFSVEASSFLVLFFFFFSFSHGPSKTAIFKLEGLVSSFGIGGLRTCF